MAIFRREGGCAFLIINRLEVNMEPVATHKRITGLGVHQKRITVCALIGDADESMRIERRQFETPKRNLREMAGWTEDRCGEPSSRPKSRASRELSHVSGQRERELPCSGAIAPFSPNFWLVEFPSSGGVVHNSPPLEGNL
jgi:hypothetical protein